MLDALKKAVGMQSDKGLEQDAPIIEAKQISVEASLAEQLTVALNDIVTKDNLLGDLSKQIDSYKEQLANLQSYADEAQAKALAAAEELKAKELADKKQMLADVIGGDNPGFDTTFAAIANLEGEAFNVVVNGFKAAFEKESETPFFKEMGVSGEAEPAEDKEESATARIIKQTYQNQ